MRWPWSKREPEQRSTAVGYTAALTAALQAGAEGGVSDTAPLATAALEAASGLYARCMAAAVAGRSAVVMGGEHFAGNRGARSSRRERGGQAARELARGAGVAAA